MLNFTSEVFKPLSLIFSMAVLMGSLSLGGCNTMEGAGRDIQEAGEELEESAD